MKKTIFAFVLIVGLAACGDNPSSFPAPEPVPTPEPAPVELAMSYGEHGWWSFDNHATMPYQTASIMNKSDWSSGTITFSIRNLSYESLPAGKDFFLFVAKLKGNGGKEANFQYNIADLTPRLISQRFDGTCTVANSGRDFCEHQAHGGVNWNSAETYTFTFTWNTSTVNVMVRDSSGNTVHSGSVATDGTYTGVEWIRVGNGVLPPYPGVTGGIVVIDPFLG